MAAALPGEGGGAALGPAMNGSFSCDTTVYKGFNVVENKSVILKKFKFPLTHRGGLDRDKVRDVGLLRAVGALEHENILKMLDVIHSVSYPPTHSERFMKLYLLYENLDQNLRTFIGEPSMEPKTIKGIMKQVLSGIEFLHANHAIHGDLKPENILVTNDLKVKLSDFGLSRINKIDMRSASNDFKLWYRAPEALLDLPYENAIDIWACGCLIAEMLLSTPLFDGKTVDEQLDKIFKVIGLPTESDWPENNSVSRSFFKPYPQMDLKTVVPNICSNGEDLLKEMLKFDSTKRIFSCFALLHPYFEEA